MEAHIAIVRFCNYQERSQQEVRNRLYEYGLNSSVVEAEIAQLIESGLLNEQRFASAYARGKFKLKCWGKIKIIQGLKRHRISAYLIDKALKEIDASAYFATAIGLAEAKFRTLPRDKDIRNKQKRVSNYLLQKGYEVSLIREVLSEIQTLKES